MSKRSSTTILVRNPAFDKRMKTTGRTRPVFKKKSASVRKAELKNIDVTVSNPFTFGQLTANVSVLNVPCIEGTAPTTHVGRQIRMRSLTSKMHARMAGTSVGQSPLRMLYVYDRQPNGAIPATTQIVQTDEITGLMNLANSHRFQVLADVFVEDIGTYGPGATFKSIFRKLDHVTEFNETNGGTIADIQTGSILLLTWQAGVTIASPASQINCRIRFEDS